MWKWFKAGKNRNNPVFWQEYLACFDEPVRKQTPVEDLRFVVFDTETSGLNLQKDHLLSIGAVAVEKGQIDIRQSFECFIQKAYRPEPESIAIHGILPVIRPGDLTEDEAVRAFLRFCGNAVLVGHHIGFDLAMVNRSLILQGGGKLRNKRLDTGLLARRVASGDPLAHRPDAFSLDALCRQYHIPANDRHTAAGDAFMTAILLLKLLARLKKRGITTAGALFR